MPTINIIDKIKIWASPAILSILGMVIWTDLQEMKHDVKRLLEVSSSQQARIESLERDIALIKGTYFKKTANQPIKEDKRLPFFMPFAKHEEICDLKSQLRPTNI
jgi:hypothetical protein